jgi:hypothetical protein
MFSIILLLLYGICLFVAYRKTILASFPIFLILNLMKFASLPVSLWSAMTIAAIIVLPFKIPTHSIQKSIQAYPFMAATLLIAFSWFGTCILIPPPHWGTTIFTFACAYCYPILFWISLSKESYTKHVFMACMAMAVLLFIYVPLEILLQRNPLVDSMIHSGLFNEALEYVSDFRYGIKRSQAWFGHATSFGAICAALGFLLFWSKRYRTVGILLCAMTLVSGTRSSILGMLFMALGIVLELLKYRKTRTYLIAASIVWIPLGAYILSPILLSIFDTKAVVGSNSDMRLGQLLITIDFWLRSPVWGNGLGTLFVGEAAGIKELHGAESFWFPVLADYGIIGVMAVIFGFANISSVLYKRYRIYVFFPLGFVLCWSMTSLPGVDMSLVLIVSIFLLKNRKITPRRCVYG